MLIPRVPSLQFFLLGPGGTVDQVVPAKNLWRPSCEHLRRCTYLSLDDNHTSGALYLAKVAEFEPPHVTTCGIDPNGPLTVLFNTVDLPKPAVS